MKEKDPNDKEVMYDEPVGWICPTCRKVYSPQTKECPKCNVKEESNNNGDRILLID